MYVIVKLIALIKLIILLPFFSDKKKRAKDNKLLDFF